MLKDIEIGANVGTSAWTILRIAFVTSLSHRILVALVDWADDDRIPKVRYHSAHYVTENAGIDTYRNDKA